jgi:hypothetical protein
MEIGLSHRLRRAQRQIVDQHRHLKPIWSELEDAVARGASADALTALHRFRAALDEHFALEEGVFFPALHGLHRECEAALRGLAREHEQLLTDLDRLRDRLASGGVERSKPLLHDLGAALGDHERREEAVVRKWTGLGNSDTD